MWAAEFELQLNDVYFLETRRGQQISVIMVFMDVTFNVGTEPAVFRWTSMTGRAEIVVGDEHIMLQSPKSLSTHFQMSTERTWCQAVGGHEVKVVKSRPRLMGGLRPNSFTILVDGNVAASSSGM
jgi:hypothetical protein